MASVNWRMTHLPPTPTLDDEDECGSTVTCYALLRQPAHQTWNSYILHTNPNIDYWYCLKRICNGVLPSHHGRIILHSLHYNCNINWTNRKAKWKHMPTNSTVLWWASSLDGTASTGRLCTVDTACGPMIRMRLLGWLTTYTATYTALKCWEESLPPKDRVSHLLCHPWQSGCDVMLLMFFFQNMDYDWLTSWLVASQCALRCWWWWFCFLFPQSSLNQ